MFPPEGDACRSWFWSNQGNRSGVWLPNEDARSLERRRTGSAFRCECPIGISRCYGVLRNHSEAEDVAQDALFRAFRKLHLLRDATAV